MNEDFAAAMRRALQHVRAQDVVAATAIIQAALNGRSVAEAGSEKAVVDITPRKTPCPAQARLAGPSHHHAKKSEGVKKAEFGAPHVRKRQRQPLGDVVRTLPKLRKAGLNGLGRPQVRTPRPDIPEGAQFLTRRFHCSAGSRVYKLYIPAAKPQAWRGLIIMLHGCTQDTDDFAVGTDMNAHAEANGLLIAYPAQMRSDNPSSCWNWFNPRDQHRGMGEPAIIAGLTQSIADEFAVATGRIFIAGFSAGGAMAAIIHATYPELYAGAGIHSGLAYRSANDVMTALAAMRGESNGPSEAVDKSPQVGRTIIFHGSADAIVHPCNTEKIFAAAQTDHREHRTYRERNTGGRGRSYTRSVIETRDGGGFCEYWLIDDGGHSWSGGRTGGSYTDPAGPDASAEMVRFFLNLNKE